MTMKRRKVIFSILLIILIGFVLFVYNAFNGNPFSKYIAKKEVTSYLAEHYPDKDFNVPDGFYNFKFSEYTFDVIEIGKGDTYEFNVRGFVLPTVVYDGIYYSNLDEPLMEKLGKEAATEMADLLADKLDVIANIDVQIEVLQGTYDKETTWNKDLVIEKPLYIHITLDSTRASREDVLAAADIIQATLNKADYDYDSVTINGNVIDEEAKQYSEFGYVKYVVSFEKDTVLKMKDVREEKQ